MLDMAAEVACTVSRYDKNNGINQTETGGFDGTT